MKQPMELIKEIYDSGTCIGQSKQIRKIRPSGIDSEEGRMINDIIHDDPNVLKTLEVGCACGLSSLYICAALQGRAGAFHTIIDPFQRAQWDSVGVLNLQRCGIDFFKLIEEKSEFGLPRLLGEKKQFDFIFIDGWHTFDHTLLDCFYANRLLKVGGYLVIDDANLPSISRVVNFISKYPCYSMHRKVSHVGWKRWVVQIAMLPIIRNILAKILFRSFYCKISMPDKMVAFKKIAEDVRNWDWHEDF
jgi:predicted O-methyltransferase YrrM